MPFKLVTHKLAGKEVDDNFLKELLAKKPCAMGMAWRNPDGKLDMLQTPDKIKEFSLDGLKPFFQGETKDRFLMSWFTDQRPTLEPDMQPFIVGLNAKGDANVLAMLEGDFPPVTDSAHTPEYHVANDKLAPRIERINRLVKGDTEVLAKELYEMNQEFGELIPTKGTISLLVSTPKDVQVITTSKSDSAKDTAFGWSSHQLISGEKKSGGVVDTLTALKDKFLGGTQVPITPLTSESKLLPKSDGAEVTIEWEGKECSYDTLRSAPWTRSPPPHFKKEKEVRNWYKNYSGIVPEDWKDRVPVLSINAQKVFKLLKTKEGLTFPERISYALLMETVGKPVEEEPAKTVEATPAAPPAEEKPMTPAEKIAAIKARQAEKQKTAETLTADNILEREGVIPPEAREAISKGWLKSVLDEGGVEMPYDPAQIKKLEAEKPLFTESLGLKGLSPLYRVSRERLKQLVTNHPNEAADLLRETLLANWFKDAIAIKAQEKKAAAKAA